MIKMFYLEELEKHLKAQDMSNASVTSYMNVVRNFVDTCNIDNASDINIQVLDNYKKVMDDRGLEKSTKRKNVGYVRKYLMFLYEYKYISEDLSDKIKAPKVQRKLPVFLTEAQVVERFSKISGYNQDRDRAMVMLLLSSGVRESELCALNRDDVMGNKVVVRHGKGDKFREVYISEQAVGFLNKYLNNRNDTNEALFISTRLDRISARQVINIIEKHMGVAVHKLRHTCASLMLSHGANIVAIQQQLGHSNISTTNIYTHITQEDRKKAINFEIGV